MIAVVVASGAVATVAFTTEASAADHEIDDCTVIDEPGEYEIVADIQTDDSGPCIDVQSSDVIVDGNGHTVEGPGSNDGGDTRAAGVFVNESFEEGWTNTTVRNLEVRDFDAGFDVGVTGFDGPDASLEDVVVQDNDAGIVHRGSSLGLRNVTAEHNDGVGLRVEEAGTVSGTDVILVDNRYGIQGFESSVALQAVRIEDNDEGGVAVGPYVSVTLEDATVADNGGHGLAAYPLDSTITLIGGAVTDNDGSGVAAFGNSEAHVEDALVTGNGEDGLHANGAMVSAENVTVQDNAAFEVNAHFLSESGGEITANDLSVGPSAVTAFENETLALEPVERQALPQLPDDTSAAGDGLNASGPIEGPVDLELTVDTDDDTVDLWRHDGAEWESVVEDLPVTDGPIEATVDRNGTYAPVATEADDEETPTPTPTETPTETPTHTLTPTETPTDKKDEKDEKDEKHTPTPTPADDDGEKKDEKTEVKESKETTETTKTKETDGATETDTETETETDDTPTGQATESPESDQQQADGDSATRTDAAGEDDVESPVPADGPGFTPIAALVALLAAALLTRRLA